MTSPIPLRFAITGGIGCGKSLAGETLASLGVAVLDSDQVAHELLAGDPAVAHAIRSRFGTGVFTDGQVDRRALGAVVFTEEQARKDLEAILHTRIRTRTDQWLASQPASQPAAVIIPLLYEVGRDRDFPIVVCVACSPEVQHQRLRQRGWSDEEIRRRQTAQLPVEEKMKRAQVVIWNDGSKEAQTDQWKIVLPRLKEQPRQPS